MVENLEIILLDKTCFKLSVKKFAVPSAVFRAIFPVNPSVTITLDLPSVI